MGSRQNLNSKQPNALIPKFIYGINGAVKNHLHYCDNQTVIYPAGNYLVLHSLETGLQRFIPIYASDSSILTTGENNSDNNATVAAAAPKGASKQPQQEQQQQVERVPAGYQSTLMVMSADKRYVALVQRHPEDPHHYHHHGHGSSSGTIGSHNTVIQIFDCKKLRQHLLLRTTEPKGLLSVQFSHDGLFLFALTEGPIYRLLVFHLVKHRIIATFIVSKPDGTSTKHHAKKGEAIEESNMVNSEQIHGMALHPTHHGTTQKPFYHLHVYGNRLYRVVKYTPEVPIAFKLLGTKGLHYRNYVCHEWNDKGSIVLGTSEGSLVVCDQQENRIEVNIIIPRSFESGEDSASSGEDQSNDFDQPADEQQEETDKESEGRANENMTVECLMMASNGTLLLGTSNGYVVSMERTRISYRHLNFWNVRKMYQFEAVRNSRVLAVTMSPKNDSMVCSTDDNQIFSVNFGSSLQPGAELDTKNADSLYALQHMHSAVPEHPLVDIDLSVSNSVLVTCAADGSVDFWDIVSNELLLHERFYDDTPTGVSLHVNASLLLISFKNSIRMYQLVEASLQMIWQIAADSPRFCKFSNGGQYFVAAFDGMICAYSTWFQSRLGVIGNDSVKNEQMYWRSDDRAIIIVESTGSVAEWRIPFEIFESPHTHDPTRLGKRAASKKVYLWKDSNNTTSPKHSANSNSGSKQLEENDEEDEELLLQLTHNQGHQEQAVVKSAIVDGLLNNFTRNESMIRLMLHMYASNNGVGMELCVNTPDETSEGGMKTTAYCTRLSKQIEKISLSPWREVVGSTAHGTLVYCSQEYEGVPFEQQQNLRTASVEVAAHTSAVRMFKQSLKYPILVSVGQDKSIVVFWVRNKNQPRQMVDFYLHQQQIAQKQQEQRSMVFYESLVPRSKYRKLEGAIDDILQAEKDLRKKFTAEQITRRNFLDQQFKQTTTKHKSELDPLNQDNVSLRQGLVELRQQNLLLIEERRRENAQNLELERQEHEERLKTQQQRYEQLQEKLDKKAWLFQQMSEEKADLLRREMKAREEEYEEQLKQKCEEFDKLKAEIAQRKQEAVDFEEELGEQVNAEVLQISYKFEKELHEVRVNNKEHLKVKEDLDMQYARLTRKYDKILTQKQKFEETNATSKLQMDNLKQQVAILESELKQRFEADAEKDNQTGQMDKEIQSAQKLKYLLEKKYETESGRMEPRREVHRKLEVQTVGMRQERDEFAGIYNVGKKVTTEMRRKLAILDKTIKRDLLRRHGFSVLKQCMMTDLSRFVNELLDELDPKELHRKASEFFQRYVQFTPTSHPNAPPKGYIRKNGFSTDLDDPVTKTIINLPLLMDVEQIPFAEDGTIASTEHLNEIYAFVTDKIGYKDMRKELGRKRDYFEHSAVVLRDRLANTDHQLMHDRYKMIQERVQVLDALSEIKDETKKEKILAKL